ncbi:MAG TPA: alpha/beta fold hydrolase [Longimicrobiales bacterium]|nr:alpha/beta fold hydrolase [Longimicrobiales bacterium]
MRPKWKILAVGLLLVLAGSTVSLAVMTAGGVEVRHVRIPFDRGEELDAYLYVPPGATPETPAPAVLAVHGYINSKETQSAFAIELARRGYVVLAPDQPGHGFSGGRALEAGFGGPAALEYLVGLPFVDRENVGLEGHSMGGWAVLAAADSLPAAYRAVALVGSATGPGFAPAGDSRFPRNLMVVFSRWDEFAQLMWGVRDAADVGRSEKLKAVFDTRETVEPGRMYGAPSVQAARWLAVPSTTHPGAHLSREAVGYTVNWLGVMLEGEHEGPPPGRQIWFWKEAGTLVALVGGLLVLLGSLDLLLSLPRFAALREEPVGAVETPDRRWWLTLLAATAVPALTYFPLTSLGGLLPASPVLPQGITNQILVWALGNGVLALPLFLKSRRGRETHVGAKLAAAAAAVGILYATVLLVHWIFKSDLRFWVVALKPMAWRHVPSFLAYLVPFTAFFYVSQSALHATLSLDWAGPERQYATGVAAAAGGFTLMIAALYAWLLAAGHLPAWADPLFTIVGIQFVAVLAATGVLAIFTWRRTNGALLGALVCGLLVTWYVVAGQATHV